MRQYCPRTSCDPARDQKNSRRRSPAPLCYRRSRFGRTRRGSHLARKQKTTFEARFPARDSPTIAALAANVRRIRLGRELSQDDLASLAGVDQTAISLIENARANPTVTMIEAIAEALGATVVELIGPSVSAGK
jgi:DNA-binding XRE family transcriptional regulator